MKLVKISDVFDHQNGISSNNITIYKSRDTLEYIPYIRPTKSQLNSVIGYIKRSDIDKQYISHKNTLYISTDGEGSHSYSYISIEEFAINSNIAILAPKQEMSLNLKLVYSKLITENRYRFSYGRKPKWNKLKDILIPHPDELEKFANITIPEPPPKTPYNNKQISLNDREWKWFSYKDIFDIERGKRLKKEDRESGNILYFSASQYNNGCTDSISNPLFTENNAIIYTTFGDAYYVENNFTGSDEITILKNQNLNKYNSLFICGVLNQEKYRYCFGRKAFQKTFLKTRLSLPITNTGTPDWQFMEDYIKALPYSKAIANSNNVK